MTCGDVEERAVVEAYAAGRLGEPDREAFETHMFECEACFDRLQMIRVLRSELASRRGVRARSARPWPLYGGLAAAAVLAIAIAASLHTGGMARPAPAPEEAAANAPAAQESSRRQRITQLARFEPPQYLPPNLRGADDQRAPGFRSAMETYRAADYPAAVVALRSIVERKDATMESVFYLAIAELALGRAEPAALGLARVIASKDFVLEEEAHFFLGKARLLQGDVASARQEFEVVTGLKGDREQQARALVTAIDALPSR